MSWASLPLADVACQPVQQSNSCTLPHVGRRFLPGLLRGIGPEVLAAASDNDPTNVGTAAAVGAQTGYQLSWVVLLVGPLLAVVMSIAAQVGMVARDDLQSLTRKRYGRGVAAVLLVSVVVVNLVTIAADLMAGAAGIGQLVGVDYRWLVAPLGVALTGLLLVGKYDEVVAVLRYLLLGFGVFGVAAFMAHPDWAACCERPWSRCCRRTLRPGVSRYLARRSPATSTYGRRSGAAWRNSRTGPRPR